MVIAVNTPGREKKMPKREFGFTKRTEKQNATRILVRIVKKLKKRMTVSGTDSTLFRMIRYN